MHYPICENWDENVCEIKIDKGDKPEKQGNFFRVSGSVRNAHADNCNLPHLRLDVSFLDNKGKPLDVGVLGEEVENPNLRGNVIHVSDRAVSPDETTSFKFEGIWNDKIEKVEVKTRPKIAEALELLAASRPKGLELAKINPWQDKISLAGKSAVIQRGDIVLDAGPAQGIVKVFSAMIAMVTNSPYHHAMLYDCDWKVVHATWPKVERNSLESLYLNQPDAVLTWVRPKFKDGRAVTKAEAKKALAFAAKQIGRDYDVIANVGFLLRSDGLPGMPLDIEKLFQERNWLADHSKWHCSELAGGAWSLTVGLDLVEDMTQKDFLSPADIYTSLYHDIVCSLVIKDGKAKLYTK